LETVTVTLVVEPALNVDGAMALSVGALLVTVNGKAELVPAAVVTVTFRMPGVAPAAATSLTLTLLADCKDIAAVVMPLPAFTVMPLVKPNPYIWKVTVVPGTIAPEP
jgi:hypothetical protein